MTVLINMLMFAIPVIGLILLMCLTSTIVEFVYQLIYGKEEDHKTPEEEFGFIEIEPDYDGTKGLVTKIHWSK